jgi:hypothetical protein
MNRRQRTPLLKTRCGADDLESYPRGLSMNLRLSVLQACARLQRRWAGGGWLVVTGLRRDGARVGRGTLRQRGC